MSNEKKVVVVFLKSWRGYSQGEPAGFDQEQADSLIKGEVAELATGGKPSAQAGAKGSKRGAAKPGVVVVTDGAHVNDDAANTSTDASPADAVNTDADDEPKP